MCREQRATWLVAAARPLAIMFDTFNGVDGRGITAWQSDKRTAGHGKGFRGDVQGFVANRWERAGDA